MPMAGDAFDVLFRANMRNVRLLRHWMEKQPRDLPPPNSGLPELASHVEVG